MMTTLAKIVMTLLAVGTFIYGITLLDSRQFITGFGCLIGTSVFAFIVSSIQE
jgi:hypothetical protein